MRPQPNDQVTAADVGRYDRLPPLERPAATPRADAPRADAPPGPASFEVRYGLDAVANVWVAQFFDGQTGDFVKAVPTTQLQHQLAALRELAARFDARA